MSDLRPKAGPRKKPRPVCTDDAPVLAVQGRAKGTGRKRVSPTPVRDFFTARAVRTGAQFVLCVAVLALAVFLGWYIGVANTYP